MIRYDINFKRLALMLLPTFLRRPVTAYLSYAIVAPIAHIHTKLVRLRNETVYRLEHNGQVCHLRAALNDALDLSQRRITVDDKESDSLLGTLIFTRDQCRQTFLPLREDGRLVINRRGFSGAKNIDFWVTIPEELMAVTDEKQLTAIVNTYKLASKRWVKNII